jgi:hypothetical protein
MDKTNISETVICHHIITLIRLRGTMLDLRFSWQCLLLASCLPGFLFDSEDVVSMFLLDVSKFLPDSTFQELNYLKTKGLIVFGKWT